jgi:hypothetical protein
MRSRNAVSFLACGNDWRNGFLNQPLQLFCKIFLDEMPVPNQPNAARGRWAFERDYVLLFFCALPLPDRWSGQRKLPPLTAI